jgi:hypothetical protein
MNKAASERRRAPRARADFPIHLTPASGKAPAHLRDLSANGLCCTTSQSLPEMALVGIDLQFPGQPQQHRLEGAVVRCAPLPARKGQFEVAIFFTSIQDSARAALAAWVQGTGTAR